MKHPEKFRCIRDVKVHGWDKPRFKAGQIYTLIRVDKASGFLGTTYTLKGKLPFDTNIVSEEIFKSNFEPLQKEAAISLA